MTKENQALCPACRSLGYCLFNRVANQIANTRKDAADKNKEIAEWRKKARLNMCPKVNDVDPYYDEKELL